MSKPDPMLDVLVAGRKDDTACKLCVELPKLGKDREEAIRTALASGLGVERIWAALRAGGHPVPRRHITAHREQGHS